MDVSIGVRSLPPRIKYIKPMLEDEEAMHLVSNVMKFNKSFCFIDASPQTLTVIKFYRMLFSTCKICFASHVIGRIIVFAI